MASISNLHLSLFITSILATLLAVQANINGALSIKATLIHRDSPISPLYNPQITYFNRLQKSFRRSISRANTLTKPNSFSNKVFQSDIIAGGGEYFIRIFIGTPQLEVLAIADTGSDLIWIQCQPCDLCYKQKSPIFDPRQSSSYTGVLCGTTYCNKLDSEARSCAAQGYDKSCGYSYSYGDHSFTNGHLATETFGIGSNSSNSSIPQPIAFGCGTRNGGSFDDSGSGIIGLGGGSMSLISQLSSQIGGKFSYCLVPTLGESNSSSSTSKITFGADEVPISSWDTKVSTPLVSKQPETFYFLTLEAISVGNKRLSYSKSLINGNNEEGNIIIDSGTTLTFLDSEFFNQLESVIDESVKAERVSDPNGIFSICYRQLHIEFPIITAHFTNADVELQHFNTFAQVANDLICFTIVPSNDISIFGNLAQIDFLVGYDLHKSTVSFIPTDCTKL
ncbi:aspartic proteinase CDR1-like [Euphorbia lathyris]|uniref:aspartic proteinase CDR1-like n=1 Tax=Euphorbia lathyris TaxID=212925 RepID=UPI003313100D